MFGDEDHIAGIGILHRPHPLAGVEAVRVYLIAWGRTVVAFGVLIDVRRPMEEEAHPRFMPGDLLRSRHRYSGGVRRRAVNHDGTKEAGRS